MELAERHALRRVAGLSTELEDISEVEYRQLRLERVVLVGVWTEGSVEDAENSMAELALLAETAGSEVLEAIYQRRQSPDPATYVGRGKVEAIGEIVRATGADTVICDGELAPSQLRNLEDRLKVKVVDRTALILDIFAQHAKSKEGQAQVELAQLNYMTQRLRGWGGNLSRQVGGRVAGGAADQDRAAVGLQQQSDQRVVERAVGSVEADPAPTVDPVAGVHRAIGKQSQGGEVVVAGCVDHRTRQQQLAIGQDSDLDASVKTQVEATGKGVRTLAASAEAGVQAAVAGDCSFGDGGGQRELGDQQQDGGIAHGAASKWLPPSTAGAAARGHRGPPAPQPLNRSLERRVATGAGRAAPRRRRRRPTAGPADAQQAP
ncbi:MAG TPA: hypothetical protein PK324_23825, partial [Nocardioides sp.]|nr:hypothetical protein [Nocardioides sp.]